MTTVPKPATTSPAKTACSSSRKKQRWSDACPGVWSARSVAPPSSILSPSVIVRVTNGGSPNSPNAATSMRICSTSGTTPPMWSIVAVRDEDDLRAAVVARFTCDAFDVNGIGNRGIDDRDVAASDDVGVRASARHEPGVGGTHDRDEWRELLGLHHPADVALPRGAARSPGSRRVLARSPASGSVRRASLLRARSTACVGVIHSHSTTSVG